MWTDTTRALHARKGLALPSNLTDGEWAVLEPFFPLPSHVGRLRKWPMRRNVEAILYLLRGGLPWRMLPPCFPPASTVRRWFYLWRDSGLWKTVNHYLLMALREDDGREASPSAGVIDSQSVKTTDSGGPRGYDAGKKTKGRKRHIITDTLGFLVGAVIHAADIQDRDGAPDVLASIGDSYDNALAETINGLYKAEIIWRQRSWPNASAVEMATLRWVDWFNNHRLFGPIGHIPPAEAEAIYYAAIDNLDMVP